MLGLRKMTNKSLIYIGRAVYLTCCCGFCSALRPRYKRLVDNIFPASPEEGLVKSNMEKLVFYSLSSPEKLDRIGEYLFQKANRDIQRRRHGYVLIAMEAMDQLLAACHSQTLNLFVESFLKMVHKLLESADPQLHILATQSFVRFANIEEDTPSYHRRYDFFVSKFAAMCHSNHNDVKMRDKIRLAGIQGLQGVIRKTVSDDLVENIWEAQHMDKIVPSLLYNMQFAEKYETIHATDGTDGGPLSGPCSDENPARLSEACLRELLARASFGHIRSVLTPVLTHFDRHDLWMPNDFAVHTFKIIMFSIQAQYSYSVVEALMQHLEAPGGGARGGGGVGTGPRGGVRAARAVVLASIVAIAAADSVGPSVLEIINNLLTLLRTSVARDSEKESDEKLYQEALINALGEFADHLPDYQKIDIMMFIVSKIPSQQRLGKGNKPDVMLQSILLKSLLKVGTTYKTIEYSKAFPSAFLDSLLRVSSCEQAKVRALLQRILHTLLDRHANATLLMNLTVEYEELGLTVEKCSRQDIIFINKHGLSIFSSLYEGLQLESNTVENIESIFTTLALLVCELACDETVPDMVQLILSIQQSALNNPVVSRRQKCHLHSVVISLLALLAHVMGLTSLAEYVQQIVDARKEDGRHLLPPLLDDYDECVSPSKLPFLMVDQMAVCEILSSCGIEVAASVPYGANLTHRHSWLETGAQQGRDSLADITAGPTADLDSANSSPGVQRQPPQQYDDLDEEYRMFTEQYNQNHRPSVSGFGYYRDVQSEAVSIEALRRVCLGEPEREVQRRHMAISQAFRTQPFSQLMHMTRPKYELREKLEELLNSVSDANQESPNKCSTHNSAEHDYFPELFLY